MFEYIFTNLPTVIGALIILVVFIAIVAKGIYNKKHHKGGCCGGCGGCPNSSYCHGGDTK